jgi:transposase
MSKQCRSFTAEFKREAADLVLKQSCRYIEASRSLGIGESALRRWVDQVQKGRQGVTPQSKTPT